mmetsp:Transcript_6983/g.13455  ORF Transcript_6983/g.13455 Transcript_6983/m.13455 type:complete len:400 (-) Transcript_6983:265-1464(-)
MPLHTDNELLQAAANASFNKGLGLLDIKGKRAGQAPGRALSFFDDKADHSVDERLVTKIMERRTGTCLRSTTARMALERGSRGVPKSVGASPESSHTNIFTNVQDDDAQSDPGTMGPFVRGGHSSPSPGARRPADDLLRTATAKLANAAGPRPTHRPPPSPDKTGSRPHSAQSPQALTPDAFSSSLRSPESRSTELLSQLFDPVVDGDGGTPEAAAHPSVLVQRVGNIFGAAVGEVQSSASSWFSSLALSQNSTPEAVAATPPREDSWGRSVSPLLNPSRPGTGDGRSQSTGSPAAHPSRSQWMMTEGRSKSQGALPSTPGSSGVRTLEPLDQPKGEGDGVRRIKPGMNTAGMSEHMRSRAAQDSVAQKMLAEGKGPAALSSPRPTGARGNTKPTLVAF